MSARAISNWKTLFGRCVNSVNYGNRTVASHRFCLNLWIPWFVRLLTTRATEGFPDRVEMKKVLADIQSGRFTKEWMLENKVNQTSFKATRAKLAQHPIEEIGEKLRGMMPWIKERALVDRSRN